MTDGSFFGASKRLAARVLLRSVEAVTSPSATITFGHVIRRMKDVGRRSDIPSHIEHVQHILVLRPDGIGDVIMTAPFLRELKHARPRARITLVVAPRSLDLVQLCPYVDEVLTVEIPPPVSVVETWWRPLKRRVAALSLAQRHLWAEKYDLALVPRWGVDRHEASVLAYLSGAPIRLGYSENVSAERKKTNRCYDALFTQVIDDRSVKHEVQRNLALLSELRINASEHRLEAWLSREDEDFANEVLTLRREEPLVAIGPGAGHPKRVWPIDRFVEVGRWLTNRAARLVVIGGPSDKSLGIDLRRRLGSSVIDLTNGTTLRQSVAVLRHCLMFCGNDGGPMHLAAAAGIPVVEISCHPPLGDELHPNSPTRFGPWGVPHRVVRPKEAAEGCSTGCCVSAPHCILNVRVSTVITAIESLLDEIAPSRGGVVDLS
jgi:ADP-heptose:LPS heptosyltransferase